MERHSSRSIAALLLSALVSAAASAQTVSPSAAPGGVAPSTPGGAGGLITNLFKETTVMVSEQEQAFLDKQREVISKGDKRRAKADKARRDGYSEMDNAIIAANYKQFKGLAEGEKDKHPSSGDKAIERIKKIEDMKRNIIRFERYYDESSEEVESLLSSLEDYYEELEGATYTASSFAGELIIRGEDYSEATEGWKLTVYSEIFGLASLFRYSGTLGYKELIKKGGSILGSKGLANMDKDDCIMVADSLFARAVPMLFATLSYKVARGVSDSQYLLIPVSLTLARTDNLKEVLTVGREGLTTGSFYMDPQLAVSRSATAGGVLVSGTAGKRQEGASAGKKQDASGSGNRKETAGEGKASSDGKESKPRQSSKGKEKEKPKQERGGEASSGGLSGGNPFMEKMLSKQKKRRALFLSMDTAIYSFANYNIMDLDLNSIKLNFEFANNEYFFYGGGLSWRYTGRNSESFYGAFVNGGANITLFQNFRPYVLVEASANTGAELGLGAGCGLDFVIKHLLLNVNCAFNWSYDADLKTGDKSSTFATAGFGIGFTW